MWHHPVKSCVFGLRAGRHRVARKESDSETRSSHLLLGWSSHHAQYAGLCTLVQRDCSQARKKCKVNVIPYWHMVWAVVPTATWVLFTFNRMRVTQLLQQVLTVLSLAVKVQLRPLSLVFHTTCHTDITALHITAWMSHIAVSVLIYSYILIYCSLNIRGKLQLVMSLVLFS